MARRFPTLLFIDHLARPTGRLYAFVGALVVLGGLAAGVSAIGPPEMPASNLPRDGTVLAPWHPLMIEVPALRLTLATVVLQEAPLGDAATDASKTVPVKLLRLSEPAPWENTNSQMVWSDGGSLLRPDASYRLILGGDWSPLALPWLKSGRWSVEYSFTTRTSPKPLIPDGPLFLRYEQPVTLQWNTPITKFDYRVSPSVASTSALDPEDPRKAHVVLRGYVPGQAYQVEITSADGADGIAQQRPYSFSVVTPKSATPTIGEQDTLRYGEPVVLRWDEEIADFDYQLDPPAPSTAEIDPTDRRRATITVHSLRQGQEYSLTITAATAENGAPMPHPHSFVLTTPPALDVVETSPGDGAFGIDSSQAIGVEFSAPVEDRGIAERAMTITPSVYGHFEWPSEREMRFVPDSPFPFEEDVTVSIAGGRLGPRGKSGSYLEDDVTFEFSVRPDKLIEVDLSRQVVLLKEGDQVVFSTLTSTGVRGAETPTGSFMVQYKMKSTRMRGVTPSGSRYDIAAVPWVLAFWDDYTIHGADWRRGFGFPQSNGCISLPVAAARHIFEWAPMGTPIEIHY